ncbi:hypothetical protein CP532_2723 [Ophiocordyceps camponoti-leonardi (nom. inval.)]|nr:hypothetical protein CP532_2723 [Ophiocordyceps camponoti-leonardi (nom. inval.)]
MKHRNRKMLFAAAATLLLGVQARIELVMSNVPEDCKEMCQPIGTLTEECDTKLPDGTDADEKLLEAQCVCTNDSFDVRTIAGLCAGCLSQAQKTGTTKTADEKKKLSVANQDIKDILSACSFSASPYTPPSTSLAKTVTVKATAPTNVDQLTKTLSRATELATGDRVKSAASPVSETTHASKLVTRTLQPGRINPAQQIHPPEVGPQWKPRDGSRDDSLINDQLTLAIGADLDPPSAELWAVSQEEGDDSLASWAVDVEDSSLVAHQANGSRRTKQVLSADTVEVIVDRNRRQKRKLLHQNLVRARLCCFCDPAEAFAEAKRRRRHLRQGEAVDRKLRLSPVVVRHHPSHAGHAETDGRRDEADSRHGGGAGLSLDPEADDEAIHIGVHHLDFFGTESGEERLLMGELDFDADYVASERVEGHLIVIVGREDLITLVFGNVLDHVNDVVIVDIGHAENLRVAIKSQARNPVAERDGNLLVKGKLVLAVVVVLAILSPTDSPVDVNDRLGVFELVQILGEEGGQVDGRLERRREGQGQRMLHVEGADPASQLPHGVVLVVVCEGVCGGEERCPSLPDASPVGEAENLVVSSQLRCLAEVASVSGATSSGKSNSQGMSSSTRVSQKLLSSSSRAADRDAFRHLAMSVVSRKLQMFFMMPSSNRLKMSLSSDPLLLGDGQSREVLIVPHKFRDSHGRHRKMLCSRCKRVKNPEQSNSHVRDFQAPPLLRAVVFYREIVESVEENLGVDIDFDTSIL